MDPDVTCAGYGVGVSLDTFDLTFLCVSKHLFGENQKQLKAAWCDSRPLRVKIAICVEHVIKHVGK